MMRPFSGELLLIPVGGYFCEKGRIKGWFNSVVHASIHRLIRAARDPDMPEPITAMHNRRAMMRGLLILVVIFVGADYMQRISCQRVGQAGMYELPLISLFAAGVVEAAVVLLLSNKDDSDTRQQDFGRAFCEITGSSMAAFQMRHRIFGLLAIFGLYCFTGLVFYL